MALLIKKFRSSLVVLIAIQLLLLSTSSFSQVSIPSTTAPINATTYSENDLFLLAQNTAQGAFNYNYQDYQQKLQQLSANFSIEGWQLFAKALAESNNITVMQQFKLNMTGQITGTSKIIFHSKTNNVDHWIVELPIQVTYTSSDGRKLVRDTIVHVGITAVPRSVKANGLAVTQFVAKPDISKSPYPK